MKLIQNKLFSIFVICIFFTLPAYAIGIKENSIITDNTIKLGDVFYNLEHDQDRILGAAPLPGDDLVLNARTLLRISLALGLDWRPTSHEQQVRIQRKATIITKEKIESKIKDALMKQDIYGDYALQIPAQYQKIILPYNQPSEMEVTDLKIDTNHKNFSATIMAPSRENPIQQLTIDGSMQPVIQVPVLIDNRARGQVIKEKDVALIKILERDFTRNTISTIEELIGMSPRRLIAAGRPIQTSELIAPQIVTRGELITIFLNEGSLSLTTQVKALESGAKGDIIRVVNINSNKSLQALVTGEKQVSVISN